MRTVQIILSRPETADSYAMEFRIVGSRVQVFVGSVYDDEGSPSDLRKRWDLTPEEYALLDEAYLAAQPARVGPVRGGGIMSTDAPLQAKIGSRFRFIDTAGTEYTGLVVDIEEPTDLYPCTVDVRWDDGYQDSRVIASHLEIIT